jgi:hypothetical protein
VAGSGFALALPAGWLTVELDPRRRSASHRQLVAERVRAVPELARQRSSLLRLLGGFADEAVAAGAVYAAVLEEQVAGEALTAALTVTLLSGWGSPPPVTTGSGTWQKAEPVDLPSGRAVRVFGVEDVDLPGGRWVRTVSSHLYVPLPDGRTALLSCSSTAVDLAEPLLDLFEAISAGFVLLPADCPSGAA